MNIIAICNQKGGVGKTTLTINLGAALAHLGQRVLLMDLDPQGHLTEGVGLQEAYLGEDPNIFHCLVGNKAPPIAKLVHQLPNEPFCVIPSSYQLMLAEQNLFMARNREHKLKALLVGIQDQFDWILIDCPPSLGNLTDNALNAARQVVVPIQAEATSVRAIELLFDQIESIEKGLGIEVEVLAVVPNLVQDSAMAKKILSDLRQHVSTVTPFEMRKRVMLQAAWSQGCSIFAFKPSGRADEQIRSEITALYEDLAVFVMDRVKQKEARK